MNKKNSVSILLILAVSTAFMPLLSQEVNKQLTLEEVINLSQEQSIEGIIAKQVFEQGYWEYRTFKAEFLPLVTINLDLVNYSRQYMREYNENSQNFEPHLSNTNTTGGNLTITQNVALTGGTFNASGNLVGYNNLTNSAWDYSSDPNISFAQPIGGYNAFRWEKKIAPKKYEIAKKRYIQSLQEISIKAIDLFFDLSAAQISVKIAEMNYHNADTLYKIAQGRYQIGTISENELLQMELSYLNSKTDLNNTRLNLSQAKHGLRSYLGFNESVNILLTIPDSVPHLEIEVSKALEEAIANNPEILTYEANILEAERNVAEKLAQKRINADLFLSYGLTRVDTLFPEIITNRNNISNMQLVNVGIKVPIVDWGLKKGYYKMARLNQEITMRQTEQAIIDFNQSVILQVLRFNMQEEQFEIAKKSEYVANKKYEVTKQRFLIGKIDVLELNIAQKEKDAEKINYINAIRSYWRSLYEIRRTTLYDFVENESFYKKFSVMDESVFFENK